MKKMFIPAMLAALLILAAACSGKGDASEANGKGSVHPVAVETAAVFQGEMIEEIPITGGLSPKFETDVKSEVSGLVREVYVSEWVKVGKGTPLARIDDRDYQALLKKADASLQSARAALLQARVSGSRAERELERMNRLKQAGLVTQQTLDDAGTACDGARAAEDAALAQIRYAQEELSLAKTRRAKCLITAPMDGTVSLRSVNPGDLVAESGLGTPLFHIVDTRTLNMTVSVPSTESAALAIGQPIEFITDALPARTFCGKVMFINPVVSEADRAVKITAEVSDPLLKPGMFVRGRIVTAKRAGVLQVPKTALSGWDVKTRRARVFVAESDKARRCEVLTGTVQGDLVEIVAGLSPGQAVITRGGFNVREGSLITVKNQGRK